MTTMQLVLYAVAVAAVAFGVGYATGRRNAPGASVALTAVPESTRRRLGGRLLLGLMALPLLVVLAYGLSWMMLAAHGWALNVEYLMGLWWRSRPEYTLVLAGLALCVLTGAAMLFAPRWIGKSTSVWQKRRRLLGIGIIVTPAWYIFSYGPALLVNKTGALPSQVVETVFWPLHIAANYAAPVRQYVEWCHLLWSA